MITKAKIVERLLEEKHVTTEEAVVLLQEIGPIRMEPYIAGDGTSIVYPNNWIVNDTFTTSENK